MSVWWGDDFGREVVQPRLVRYHAAGVYGSRSSPSFTNRRTPCAPASAAGAVFVAMLYWVGSPAARAKVKAVVAPSTNGHAPPAEAGRVPVLSEG
jgi:hypothetical protein